LRFGLAEVAPRARDPGNLERESHGDCLLPAQPANQFLNRCDDGLITAVEERRRQLDYNQGRLSILTDEKHIRGLVAESKNAGDDRSIRAGWRRHLPP